MSMGSLLKLSAWTDDESKAVAAFNDIFHDFHRLEDLMSVWRPNSDVVRMNQAAGDHPVPISDDTRAVLVAARQASEWTNGKFDITFGALADIWKFDQDQDDSIPTAESIRARLPFVDYTLVHVDGAAKTGFIAKRGARIHLGGIGKGYAVDRAADLLRGRGFADFMIQSGGDPCRRGLNDGNQRSASTTRAANPEIVCRSTSAMVQHIRTTNGVMKDGRRYTPHR